MLHGFAEVLEPDGLVLFSYLRTEEPDARLPDNGWHYPHCVAFPERCVAEFIAETGLVFMPIPWHHPEANWYLTSRLQARLPTPYQLQFLRGGIHSDR
jgi:hypothetical protein